MELNNEWCLCVIGSLSTAYSTTTLQCICWLLLKIRALSCCILCACILQTLAAWAGSQTKRQDPTSMGGSCEAVLDEARGTVYTLHFRGLFKDTCMAINQSACSHAHTFSIATGCNGSIMHRESPCMAQLMNPHTAHAPYPTKPTLCRRLKVDCNFRFTLYCLCSLPSRSSSR